MVSRPLSQSQLTLVDWATLPPERVAPLYAAESDRWTTSLEWNTSASWAEVEQRRQGGALPGFAVLDHVGTVIGWTCYAVRHQTLQIGSFVAATDAVAQRLLDGVLDPKLTGQVEAVAFFAFADAPGLAPVLRGRGLAVDRYWYMGRDLERQPPPRVPDIRRWRSDDLEATASLFARAYPARDEARPFVPGGRLEDWSAYLAEVSAGSGCGPLIPDACVAVPAGPNRLVAVALVSRISDQAAHLVQLVVDPQQRGRHLGRYLLDLVSASAAQAGCRRMTLFVGGKNSVARSLYESSRFQALASFVSAGTLQPRRSTSVAPGTAVITRR